MLSLAFAKLDEIVDDCGNVNKQARNVRTAICHGDNQVDWKIQQVWYIC